ncbi:AMP-binding protein [Amycolatopsis sp. DG1A-15b]|uniref:AMP-binding protein n=1 Tax=Amycolatopsis sp. DG1A-15b TaxID=3052846 RepID=UPI00255B430C|nr:AMP-binding protein [Amycolatopsis sp. DG1A-15b]WIX91445.1 AMP-binding protein [Amycolatopsis sp. DG1A-15b]
MTTAPVTRFSTSGTTGAPVGWLRTEAQLVAETELLARLLDADPAVRVDAVFTHAPPAHLYGHLTGVRLPEVLGVPVRQVPQTAAFDVGAARHPLLVLLPASFAVLERSSHAFAHCARVTMVFSSAAIPEAAGAVRAALGPRARLVELFGSTETGLVATREHGGSPEWTLAPDVRFADALLAAGEGRLTVSSPRLAAREGEPPPGEHRLDDLVRVTGPATFRWEGRDGRLLKVNGRRLDVDRLLSELAGAAPGHVLRCCPERDDVRGEWFTVTVEPTETAAAGAGVPATLAAAVEALPAWQRPRALIPVARNS